MPMVNGEDTSDVPGSEEHNNTLGVPSSSTTSLTKAIPDPTVTQVGERIAAGPANAGDSQTPARFNLTIGDCTAMVAPTSAIDVANVGGVAIPVAPYSNPVAQIYAGVEVIVNTVGPLAHNAGVVPTSVVRAQNVVIVGAHNVGVVFVGQAPLQLNLGGTPTMPVVPPALALAQPYFNIEAGLSGPPLQRSQVAPPAPALALTLAQPYFNIEAGLSGPSLRRSQVAPPALAFALAQPYFNIEVGLLGPPLRRSEVGPFF